ncbi:MAG: hypothetical protein LBH08_03225 [Puniceicoccales bacterium]|jgi:hypothetical protein|nr:hypothetical protein [Puniceicoccales bacterium]
MKVNPSSDSEDINPGIAEKTGKLSSLENMKIATEPSSTEKAGETIDIQQNSSDKIQEISKTKDIQSTQQASNSGVFGGFKIGSGKSSNAVKSILNSSFNVSGGSLTDRQ